MRKTAPAAPPRGPSFAKDVAVLDSLVRRLLCSGWDEKLRRQAVLAAAQAAAVERAEGSGRARKLCRSILSLLALQGADAEDLRGDIGARLLELLAGLEPIGRQGFDP